MVLEHIREKKMTHSKPRVCRRLFGSMDQDSRRELQAAVARESALAKDEFKKKYNFDIDSDTPVSNEDCDQGYEWTAVDATLVPAFYTKGYSDRKRHRSLVSSTPERLLKRKKLVFDESDRSNSSIFTSASSSEPQDVIILPGSERVADVIAKSEDIENSLDTDCSNSANNAVMVQSRISDYMKARKRPHPGSGSGNGKIPRV